MTILVTGGTGFLGRAIVRSLLSQGKGVRALVRPQSDSEAPKARELTTALGDVRDAASIRAAMADCDTVVHAAALVDYSARRREVDATNVGGLRNVLDAARHHRVRKVVTVSSFLALGPTSGEIADADRAGNPRRGASDYEQSKAAADRITQTYVSTGLPVVTVFPTLVYGPGPVSGGNLLSALITDLTHGRLGGIAHSPDHRLSLAHVEDVAHGITRAVDRAEPGDRIVLGGENLTIVEIFRALEDANSILAFLPRGKLARLFRGKCSTETRFILGLLENDWAYSSAKAEKELRYRVRPFLDGVKETVSHLLQQGLLAGLV